MRMAFKKFLSSRLSGVSRSVSLCMVASVLLLAAGASNPASAVVITFDEAVVTLAGQIIDTEYQVSHGVEFAGFTAAGVSNPAVVFNTNAPTGGDADLGAPFTHVTDGSQISPDNVLILHEQPNQCDGTTCTDPDDIGARPAGSFEVTFASPIWLESIDFFDIELLEDGATPNNRIVLFGTSGELPDLFYTPNTNGDNQWDRLFFGVSGVSKIEIRMGGSGAFDNLTYRVPEPASLALFGFGLIGLGLLRRRRAA